LCLQACLLAAVPRADADDAVHHFSVASQDLGRALNELSAAADEQLLFSADLVRGIRSQELRGDYTFIDALTRLLTGTGLRMARAKSGVVLIVRDTETQPAAPSSNTGVVNAPLAPPLPVE